MNNFTKEYIELCKDKRIQDLRTELYEGNWYFDEGVMRVDIEKVFLFSFSVMKINKKQYWLPTGDQLDEEIIKICKEMKFFTCYQVGYYENKYHIGIAPHIEEGLFKIDSNPLIAKIKLLLELLKENDNS